MVPLRTDGQHSRWGFMGAPPTLSWPKGRWPNNRFLYCIVLTQKKWHSSGPFSCNSMQQNTSVLFLPVELDYINSNTFRLIWWQMKTDTGGENHANLVTRQPSPLCLSSLSRFSWALQKSLWAIICTHIPINIFIQNNREICTYMLFKWYILCIHAEIRHYIMIMCAYTFGVYTCLCATMWLYLYRCMFMWI